MRGKLSTVRNLNPVRLRAFKNGRTAPPFFPRRKNTADKLREAVTTQGL